MEAGYHTIKIKYYMMKTVKHFILLIILSLISLNIYAQKENPTYDSVLAKSMGADEYGMKSYVFVMLKSGSATIENKQVRDSLFSRHLRNIQRLEDEGYLLVAGPLGNNDKSYRGIFIFDVASPEEAEALLKTDPAIKSKIFDTDLYEWYGSAALGEYLKVHKKIVKELF